MPRTPSLNDLSSLANHRQASTLSKKQLAKLVNRYFKAGIRQRTNGYFEPYLARMDLIYPTKELQRFPIGEPKPTAGEAIHEINNMLDTYDFSVLEQRMSIPEGVVKNLLKRVPTAIAKQFSPPTPAAAENSRATK